jgi:hypothetical protein
VALGAVLGAAFLFVLVSLLVIFGIPAIVIGVLAFKRWQIRRHETPEQAERRRLICGDDDDEKGGA